MTKKREIKQFHNKKASPTTKSKKIKLGGLKRKNNTDNTVVIKKHTTTTVVNYIKNPKCKRISPGKKEKKEHFEQLIDESVFTGVTEDVVDEKEKREIEEKAQKGIAYYQFLYGKQLKKENNDVPYEGSSAWILRSALSGCSTAQAYILDNIEEIVCSILGNKPENFNYSVDIFLIWALGYFLFNYRTLKKNKTYEEWQRGENTELIKIDFLNDKNKCDTVVEEKRSTLGQERSLITKNLISQFNLSTLNINSNKKGNNFHPSKLTISNETFKLNDISSYEPFGLSLLNKAASKNYILAQLEILKKQLVFEPLNESKRQEYRQLIETSAGKGIDVAQYLFAEEYLLKPLDPPSDEMIDKCINYLEASANNGYYFSQYHLAKIKEKGLYNNLKNFKDAFFWCSKSAEQGYAEAEFTLSTYYGSGIGTRKNEKIAFELMMKADASYHNEASLYVGLKYKDGIGCEQSDKLAFKYVKKSFYNYRNLEACFTLGSFYFSGVGTAKNVEAALKCYTHAAKHGHSAANYMLGEIYYTGDGVEVNYKKAFLHYRKAATNNNAKALCKLALCFILGHGIYRDHHRALACLSTATNIDLDEVDRFCNHDNGKNIRLFESLGKYKYLVENDNTYID